LVVIDGLSRWWSGISLRTKVTGVTVLLVTLGLIVAGVGTMTVLRSYLLDEADRKITSYAQELPRYISDTGFFDREPSDPLSYYVALLDTRGELIQDNLTEEPEEVRLRPTFDDLQLAPAGELSAARTLSNETLNAQWRVTTLTLQTSGSADLLTLVIGVNLADTNSTIAQFAAIFFGFSISVVLLGGALTRLLVTTTFEPLRAVERTAAEIARGDFGQRLAGATPNTEVGRLNRSLNIMLSRIDRAFTDRDRTIVQMRRFIGDASHELRTPLVSLRGYAELYRMGALQTPEAVSEAMGRIESEAKRMGELVEDLLELARIDEDKPLQLTPVDLVPLAQDAARDTMAAAPGRTVQVVELDPSATAPLQLPVPGTEADTDADGSGKPRDPNATGPIGFAGATLARLRAARRGRRGATSTDEIVLPTLHLAPPPPPAVVLAEENKIRQVITNLIGNANRYTPPETPIEIAIGTDPTRHVAILDIVDHGEGIPEQVREKIFQRFWRADTSRARETGGTGLGLSIVEALVAKHRGSVEVLETPGGGATFRLLLPLLPKQSPPADSTEAATAPEAPSRRS
jgi:two-component system OmpR family sensor kinase